MRFILATFIVFATSALASAQTTRPANDSQSSVAPAWERQISSFAAAAAGRNFDTLANMLPDKCYIHRFNGQRDTDTSGLDDFLTNSVVVGDHAYISPPTGVAADVADDIASSESVPDSAKKNLELDEKSGSNIAMKWISQTLGTEDGTPIGVIVLWTARPDVDTLVRPIFVLIKGEKGDDGFKITTIVYGDPLQ